MGVAPKYGNEIWTQSLSCLRQVLRHARRDRSARVVARDNDLSQNRHGIVAEAGFLVANTAQRGSIDLTLIGNLLTGTCQTGLLVALNSQAGAIGSAGTCNQELELQDQSWR